MTKPDTGIEALDAVLTENQRRADLRREQLETAGGVSELDGAGVARGLGSYAQDDAEAHRVNAEPAPKK